MKRGSSSLALESPESGKKQKKGIFWDGDDMLTDAANKKQSVLPVTRHITLKSGEEVVIAPHKKSKFRSLGHDCALCDASFSTVQGLRGHSSSLQHKQKYWKKYGGSPLNGPQSS